MQSKDGESRHHIYWKGLRQCDSKRLSKKEIWCSTLEPKGKLSLKSLSVCATKNGEGSTQTVTAVWGINLIVKQLLHVVYGQQVLAIHGGNDRIPDLRNKYLKERVRGCVWVSYKTHLGLVSNLWIRGHEDLGIYAFRQSSIDVPPRCPDWETKHEGTSDKGAQ